MKMCAHPNLCIFSLCTGTTTALGLVQQAMMLVLILTKQNNAKISSSILDYLPISTRKALWKKKFHQV